MLATCRSWLSTARHPNRSWSAFSRRIHRVPAGEMGFVRREGFCEESHNWTQLTTSGGASHFKTLAEALGWLMASCGRGHFVHGLVNSGKPLAIPQCASLHKSDTALSREIIDSPRGPNTAPLPNQQELYMCRLRFAVASHLNILIQHSIFSKSRCQIVMSLIGLPYSDALVCIEMLLLSGSLERPSACGQASTSFGGLGSAIHGLLSRTKNSYNYSCVPCKSTCN